MIKFFNTPLDEPYLAFRDLYQNALNINQDYIEAICISSYSKKNEEVNSRYVNLKYIEDDKWVFFTNYNSPKNDEFINHSQISCTFFWHKTNTQVRIKANIHKLSQAKSDEHFSIRSDDKNALAISSNQSAPIDSYASVELNYKKTLNSDVDLRIRPEYWGGYYFTPYYFEFWTGHKSRLNKRVAFSLNKNLWVKIFLEP